MFRTQRHPRFRLLPALAGFLLAACATAPPSAPVVAQPPKEASAALDGAALYAEKCAMCHGDAGKGGTARHIAGKPAWATREVLRVPIGPMSEVKLTTEGRDAVSAYVASLK